MSTQQNEETNIEYLPLPVLDLLISKSHFLNDEENVKENGPKRLKERQNFE